MFIVICIGRSSDASAGIVFHVVSWKRLFEIVLMSVMWNVVHCMMKFF